MPTTPHIERHFRASETVRDIVIGMSDGLTVPFALAAGISGAVQAANIVVTAGLAEIAAGSIAMGLGGYLAARSDAEHYHAERQREEREIVEVPALEQEEVAGIFRSYGLKEEQIRPVVAALSSDPQNWVAFMMQEGARPGKARACPRPAERTDHRPFLYRRRPDPAFPYILLKTIPAALPVSVVLTLLALFIFGAVKGRFTGVRPLRSGPDPAGGRAGGGGGLWSGAPVGMRAYPDWRISLCLP